MRYRVRLQRHVVETAWVEVEATDEESAESMALNVAANAEWTYDEPGDGEVEIVDIESNVVDDERNGEGLTWDEWRNAVRREARNWQETCEWLVAWRNGVDPAEYVEASDEP